MRNFPGIMQKITFSVLILVLCSTQKIFGAETDSTEHRQHVFHVRHLIAPAALVTVGALGVNQDWFKDINHHVRDNIQEWNHGKRFHADDYVQYVPAVANVFLGFTGIKSKHPFRERFAATLTASAALTIMVNGIKYTVREARPGTKRRNSFPSGHTATAFMGAELMREEYGNAWGAGAYVIAGGVAFLRMYNDRHWLNDVIAGAGVGILAARIGYWLLPLERKLFRWEEKKQTITLFPAYLPETKTVSFAFNAQF